MSVTSCISWILLAIITATIAITLLCKYPAWDSKKKDSNGRPNKSRHEKWFYVWLIGLSTLGGFWALFLPLALNQKFDGPNADGNQLRLHLLYITGGVLALTTLGETHRKNTLEKHKNDQDHTRQVHAERRSRYTAAIEQLSSDKASIRLGGVYTLVGLVDEWLADEKTIPNFEERHKEGQVIINNLCAYIRSPFLIAERAEQLDEPYAKDLQKDFDGDAEKFDTDKRAFTRDKAALEEERQIRLSIIQEIRERLRNVNEPGPWSGFGYDFSNSHFFYIVEFQESNFKTHVNFHGSNFIKNAHFIATIFSQGATFSDVKFFGNAIFFWADFSAKTYSRNDRTPTVIKLFSSIADFSRAVFTQEAEFSKTSFSAPIFRDPKFFKTQFLKGVNFSSSTFDSGVDFSSNFIGIADFSKATFTGGHNLLNKIKFYRSVFTSGVNFEKSNFNSKPIFKTFIKDKTYRSKFSCKVNSKEYNFEADAESLYEIETKEQEHNGTKFIIPKDAELFDPDEPSEQDNNDDS
mgnify:CR=1 FL=1